MEMARGKRPELFSTRLQHKDNKIRYPLKTDSIDMLKLLLPREARNSETERSHQGPEAS